jgi:hypothetical protein
MHRAVLARHTEAQNNYLAKAACAPATDRAVARVIWLVIMPDAALQSSPAGQSPASDCHNLQLYDLLWKGACSRASMIANAATPLKD